MMTGLKQLLWSLGLTLSLGFAVVPLGCGSSGEAAHAPVRPAQGASKMPERVVQQLTDCAAQRAAQLGESRHSIRFDVQVTSDGQVDSVALADSTLGDQHLEACMAAALRSLTADDFPMRSEGSVPRGPVAPGSRVLLGQAQALPCLFSPPCLLAAVVIAGGAYIAVQIYVLASQSSTAKPKPRTAPIATTVPTATTMPTATLSEAEEKERCKKVKEGCLDKCSDEAMPTGNFGAKFHKCMRACMEPQGCVY